LSLLFSRLAIALRQCALVRIFVFELGRNSVNFRLSRLIAKSSLLRVRLGWLSLFTGWQTSYVERRGEVLYCFADEVSRHFSNLLKSGEVTGKPLSPMVSFVPCKWPLVALISEKRFYNGSQSCFCFCFSLSRLGLYMVLFLRGI